MSTALDHREHKLSLDELLDTHAPHMDLVHAVGERMINAGISDSGILTFSRGPSADHDDIAIAALDGVPCFRARRPRANYKQSR